MPEPDYENDLAFEPEMTWKELMKWARNLAATGHACMYIGEDNIYACNLEFCADGHVYVDDNAIDDNVVPCITSERTPRQIQAIIKALYE